MTDPIATLIIARAAGVRSEFITDIKIQTTRHGLEVLVRTDSSEGVRHTAVPMRELMKEADRADFDSLTTGGR